MGAYRGDADFWPAFLSTVPRCSRAYLGSFLREAVRLYQANRLSLPEEVLSAYAHRADTTAIDRRKLLDALLPAARTPEEVELLVRLFVAEGDSEETVLLRLIRIGTLPCFYVLFQRLRLIEGDTLIHRRCVMWLINHAGAMQFNLAALLTHYFGLENVPARFSLRLKPYELFRVETSYARFRELVKPF